jgi:hypothetical protein
MKVSSFKQFLEEEDSKAIVQTGINSKGIDNNVTKEIINSRLALVTNHEFLTPYIALGSISRVLAYANIIVPQYTFLDRHEGEVVFDATQFGKMFGVNTDGTKVPSESGHFVYFSYVMNDDGYYDCFAALVDQDELDDILDIEGEDEEDVDKIGVEQKVNEGDSSGFWGAIVPEDPTDLIPVNATLNNYERMKQARRDAEVARQKGNEEEAKQHDAAAKQHMQNTLVSGALDIATLSPLGRGVRLALTAARGAGATAARGVAARGAGATAARGAGATAARGAGATAARGAGATAARTALSVLGHAAAKMLAGNPSKTKDWIGDLATRDPSTQAAFKTSQRLNNSYDPESSSKKTKKKVDEKIAIANIANAINKSGRRARKSISTLTKKIGSNLEDLASKFPSDLTKSIQTPVASDSTSRQQFVKSQIQSRAPSIEDRPSVQQALRRGAGIGISGYPASSLINSYDPTLNEEMHPRQKIPDGAFVKVTKSRDSNRHEVVGFEPGEHPAQDTYYTVTHLREPGSRTKFTRSPPKKYDNPGIPDLPGIPRAAAQIHKLNPSNTTREEVESIDERKSSDPRGLAYKVTAASHAANPEWGPPDHTQDPQTHFGTAATRSSTLAAIKAIRGIKKFDVNNPEHVEAVSRAIHGSPSDYEGNARGWSQTAMTHPAQTDAQKERRAKLTGPYDDLSEPEKEKDRQIARTVATNIKKK